MSAWLLSKNRVRRRRENTPQLAVLTWLAVLTLAPAAPVLGGWATVPSGPDLYARYCAKCHGRYEKTLLPGRSASRIRSAIRQFPAMTDLGDLTDAQIEMIAAALATGPLASR